MTPHNAIPHEAAGAGGPPASFVTYEIVVSTAHEIWSVARRYVWACVFRFIVFVLYCILS